MACRRAVAQRGLASLRRGSLASDIPACASVLCARQQSSSVTIDRSGLVTPRATTAGIDIGSKQLTPMEEHLASLVLHRGGPLTVAEFMHHALTHHRHGYYTSKQDVFGSRGDFVTSPDISQMFGEAIGIWAVATWQSLGCPAKFKLVELGPGRGTLMADLLRGTKCFSKFHGGIAEISLVEVSDVLREKQLEAMGSVGMADRVKHYGAVEDVGNDADVPALYIGHEFLDAMPVHQFVKRDDVWREVLVDVAENENESGNGVKTRGSANFRLVVAPYDTFALKTILPARLRDLDQSMQSNLSAIEVSPAVIGVTRELARRVKKRGGAAILIDYGQDGPYESSLVGIKDHAFVDILADPGTVDLSAYVDFDAVRSSCRKEGIEMHGPVDQGVLLKALGIDERLHALISAAEGTGSRETADRLVDGYKRLVGGGKGEMGVRYKAVCLMPEGTPPVGFSPQNF